MIKIIHKRHFKENQPKIHKKSLNLQKKNYEIDSKIT